MQIFDISLKNTIGIPLKYTIIATLVFVTCLGSFFCVVPIPSTVVAPGAIATLRATREISHDRGGVIKSVNVLVGDRVEKGDPIIELDRIVLEAELTALSTEIVVLSAERESLIAEGTSVKSIQYSSDLKNLAAEYGLEENLLQETVRTANKKNARSSFVEKANVEYKNLNAQLLKSTLEYRAKKEELVLLKSLIHRKEVLYKEGFATRVDLENLKIREAEKRGAVHRLDAKISRLQGAIKNNELDATRIPFEDNIERLTRVAQLSREVADKKSQRKTVIEAISKTIVKAPITGQVIELSVNTVGGFLPVGQPIVSVAPDDEHMIIEARLLPREVHSVSPGLTAKIVFPTFPQREMLELQAEIESIGTDSIIDERTGDAYYLARLRIPQSILDASHNDGERTIYAGLPVEIYVTVDRMTVMAYLLKPLTKSMRKTFRA